METALVFDRQGRTIYWHEPNGRTSGSIPDTRSLWDVLWENRNILGGVAHTHPWDGEANPSGTDITTFDAIERGLGRQLLWPVVTFTHVAYVVKDPWNGKYYHLSGEDVIPEIQDIEELRNRSR